MAFLHELPTSTVLTLMISFHMSAAAPWCASPPESVLRQQWLNLLHSANEHESLYNGDIFQSAIADDLELSDSPVEIHLYGNQDSTHCNVSHIEQAGGSLQERSYCPWYNIINHSQSRYPMDLAEARCRCHYGVGMGTQSACVPVHYNVRVLRKTEQCGLDGYYEYVAGWQRTTVGCTLIHAM